jgi:hypothetical protein
VVGYRGGRSYGATADRRAFVYRQVAPTELPQTAAHSSIDRSLLRSYRRPPRIRL